MDLNLPSLHQTYAKHFLFGNIMSPYDLDNSETLAFFCHHFNALTLENAMKPVYITTAPDIYNFAEVDKMVEWANANNIKMIGHTFVWHGQSAPWLNRSQDDTPIERGQARANMQAFIKTYAGRYSGRIYSWDVMNEIFRDGGDFTGNWRDHLRTNVHWYMAYENGAAKGESGADYVFDAFYFARKYDPVAKLYYNDYNEEFPVKREAIAQMVEQTNEIWRTHPEYDGRLLIEGIGMQSHCNPNTNLVHVRDSLVRFAKTGVKISITELDATVGSEQEPANPMTREQSKQQAQMFAGLFNMYIEFAEHIERVSMWARHDGHSWRRWGAPVLFDAKSKAKEAYYAVLDPKNWKPDDNWTPPALINIEPRPGFSKIPEGIDTKMEGITYGELTEVEYFSKTTDNMRKCLVYTPPNYNAAKTYPVLYLLHGIGGIHTEWLGGSPNEIISNLINDDKASPMIVIIPNVRASKDDSVPTEVISPESIRAFDNFINDLRDDLMPFINEHYPVSAKREDCAVAGLSMGGREALFIGVSMPETFGYIGAFSPAPGLMPMQPSREPRVNHPGQITPKQMTLPDSLKDKTFILVCNGTEEPMFNDLANAYCDALRKNGINPIYYTTQGGHDFRVWKNGLYHFVRNIFGKKQY